MVTHWRSQELPITLRALLFHLPYWYKTRADNVRFFHVFLTLWRGMKPIRTPIVQITPVIKRINQIAEHQSITLKWALSNGFHLLQLSRKGIGISAKSRWTYAEKPMTYRRKANDISPKSQCRFGEIYSSFRRNSVTHSILQGFQCGFPLFSHRKSVKILTAFCRNISAHKRNN